MAVMRVGRVVLGGLAAGVLSTASGIVLGHFVLGPDYVEAILRHVPGELNPALHAGLRLLFGLLAAFLNAGLRPRFGPGPRTALVAGLVLFAAACVPLLAALAEFGILAGGWLWTATLWSAAECVACALLAGWIYREREGGGA